MAAEKFSSPSNRVLGAIGVLLGVLAIVAIVVDGPGLGELVAIFAIALAAALFWSFLIRPEIRLTSEALTLRNPLATYDVPLQLVTGVEVRRYTVIALRDGRLTSTAVSRGRLELARHDRSIVSEGHDGSAYNSAGLMTERINARLDEAALVPLPEGAGVRRTPAWLEIAVMVIATIGLIVTILL